MRKTISSIKSLLLLALMAVSMGAWADQGTITFGTNNTKIDSESVTASDDQNRSWTFTTVISQSSFTQQPTYSQVGKKDNPATSFTAAMSCADDITITAFEVKMGGFSGTAGNISLSIGDDEVQTGVLNGTNDVTVTASGLSIPAKGKTLSVNLTGIAKGVKIYYITYVYTVGGGDTPAKTATTTSFGDVKTFTITQGDAFTAPTATVTGGEGLTATYSSSNTAVATVDAATGAVTVVGVGTTTITAAFAGNDTYEASSDSYTLTVISAGVQTTSVTFDATRRGYTNQQGVTEETVSPITFTFAKGTNSNAPKYFTSGTAIRCYGGNTITVSTAEGNIRGVEFTFGSSDGTNEITASVGSFDADNTAKWEGSASSVTFTIGGSSGHRRIAKIKVTYASGSSKTATTTSFGDVKTFTITQGDTFTAPTATVTGGEGLAATYSSSNTAVATVDAATGAVTVVGVGTTTITATFAGDDDNEASSDSYTLTVNPALTVYASLEELVAAGEPTTAGVPVRVTITDKAITGIDVKNEVYRNGIYLMAGEQEVEIYCYDVPEEWEVNGTVSGTIEGTWKKYGSTWDVVISDWTALTYTAPSKSTPTLTAEGYKTTMQVGDDDDYYTVTYTGDADELTATSSDEDVAEVIIDNDEVLVTPRSAGTTTITISAPETATCNAIEFSYTLTVTAPYPAKGDVTLNFVGWGFDGASDWKSGTYASRTVKFGSKVQVYFANASKQNSGNAIVNCPVTKGNDVDIDWVGLNVTHVKVVLEQWASKTQTATLHSTVDGETYKELVSSPTFTVESDVAAGSTGAKVTFSNKSNQVGIQQIILTISDDYTREITIASGEEGKYGTICLPYSADIENCDGALFYSIAGKVMKNGEVQYLVFAKEDEKLEAGRPYIFCALWDVLVVYDDNNRADAPGSYNGLVGAWEGCDVPEGMYVMQNNMAQKCGTGCSIAANRAYIDMDEVPEFTGALVKGMVRFFLDGKDSETAIQTVAADGAQQQTYNLAGQRVAKGVKGIYIVDGKKMMIVK